MKGLFMRVEVVVKKIGMAMTEGVVAEWLVDDGGHVDEGGPLYMLETEKVQMEIEAPATGIVHHLVAADQTVTPGTVIAYVHAEE